MDLFHINLSDDDAAEVERRDRKRRGSRKCGACTACCTVMAVNDLKKRMYVRCPHLANNCTIYDDRPRDCRVWSCGWLLGQEPGGDERHRPDNLGLIFSEETIRAGLSLLLAYETSPGAGHTAKARYVLKKIAKQRPVVLIWGENGRNLEPICVTKEQERRTQGLLHELRDTRARIARQLRTDSWAR